MSEGHEGCAVCGASRSAAQAVSGGERAPERGGRLSKVVIEGRTLALCRSHTATVVAAMPETFEDLRALFVGVDLGAGPPAGPAPERRSPIERRAALDRRVFPPRPEGRRVVSGRRAGDPVY